MIQYIIESYQEWWFAGLISIPIIRYFSILFTIYYDWEKERYRFPSPLQALRHLWYEIDLVFWAMAFFGLFTWLVLWIGPFFTDQMAIL